MHELGVTQSLLDLAVRHAQQAGAARVTQLNVVIGQMANIVDDSVQFYWEIIAQDTIAAGAVLVTATAAFIVGMIIFVPKTWSLIQRAIL